MEKAQKQIEQLDQEILDSDDTLQKIKKDQAEQQDRGTALKKARADLKAHSVFTDFEKLMKQFLNLQKLFDAFKEKVEVLGTEDPTWHTRLEAQGKDSFYVTIGDAFLRPGEAKNLTLLNFFNQITSISEGLGEKSSYPELKRS